MIKIVIPRSYMAIILYLSHNLIWVCYGIKLIPN